MAIEPDLDRVRKICTDFDERWPEGLIYHIEVIGGDPPVGLGVAKARDATTALVGVVGAAGEHPLKLLSHPDRGHPTASLPSEPVQVWAHHLQLALPLGKADHRNITLSSELHDRPPKPQPDSLQNRRGRNREPQMPGQKTDHLTRHLKVRHPAVEIDPIETLQIQTDMPIQDVVHAHHTSRHDPPPGSGQLNPTSLPHPKATSPTNPATTSAVRGAAS